MSGCHLYSSLAKWSLSCIVFADLQVNNSHSVYWCFIANSCPTRTREDADFLVWLIACFAVRGQFEIVKIYYKIKFILVRLPLPILTDFLRTLCTNSDIFWFCSCCHLFAIKVWKLLIYHSPSVLYLRLQKISNYSYPYYLTNPQTVLILKSQCEYICSSQTKVNHTRISFILWKLDNAHRSTLASVHRLVGFPSLWWQILYVAFWSFAV